MDVKRQPRSKRGRNFALVAMPTGLILAILAFSRVEPAVPTVKRETLSIDTVKRGPMFRQVRGAGNLVPEQIRHINTLTPGRVERILVRPGTAVEASTALLELSNPDVHIRALESEQQLTAAEAQLVTLRVALENQRWAQESNLAMVQSECHEAVRQARVSEELAEKGLIARIQRDRAQERAMEMSKRLEVESKRLEMISASIAPQLAIQAEQVARLQAICKFQRDQVASMRVEAGASGVLQGLPLEVGQWVTPGMTLAVVAQPGRLKAVLRIPETLVRDVALNQPAAIDTRNGVVRGRVSRIDPGVQNGTVTVEVVLEEALPAGARPDMSVDGTIDVERLSDVLYMGRTVNGQSESQVGLFRLEPDGQHAARVEVQLGRGSVDAIEVIDGLRAGDKVILSDMAEWDGQERVRIR
jgi:HlyD family secretion protein